MTGISEKRVEVIVGTSRKSRKIRQHRITKTTQNQLCPNQRSQVTKMRHQNMPVHCQCVLRADVPADNRLKGTSSSKKVAQDHEVVRKIGKRANYQNEVSADFCICTNWPGDFVVTCLCNEICLLLFFMTPASFII